MTRLYYTNNGDASGLTPALDASWEKTTSGGGVTQRLALASAPGGTTANSGGIAGTGANPNDTGFTQFISPQLAAQTIAGTIKGQFLCFEGSSLIHAAAQLVIRVVASDGSIRGTLLSSNTAAETSTWATSQTNRKFPRAAASPATLSSLAIQDGDRLVVEVGARVYSTSTATSALRFVGSGAADLPEDETTTADGYPWIEFSQDLGFYVAPLTDTGAGADALSIGEVDLTAADTGAGTDALAVIEIDLNSGLDETGAGVDAMPQVGMSGADYDDSGAGADALAVTATLGSVDETGAGVDALSVSPIIPITGLDETGSLTTEVLSISAITSLSTGKLWIGRFVNDDPQYTIGDSILSHAQVEEGQTRPNIVVVDGMTDSWTEYDRGDLTARDVPVPAYFDLTELRSPGDVRTRAVQEMEQADSATSPGGDVVWDTVYTRMDQIYWISDDGSRYQTRIEGLKVDFDQSTGPFQRCTIDTGVMVLCPPDEASAYLVRDLFERATTDGLGVADTGGTWVIS